jgi:hypothetical protein
VTREATKVFHRRGQFIIWKVMYEIVQGSVAYGRTVSLQPSEVEAPIPRPIWWRTDAQKDLKHLCEYCSGAGVGGTNRSWEYLK